MSFTNISWNMPKMMPYKNWWKLVPVCAITQFQLLIKNLSLKFHRYLYKYQFPNTLAFQGLFMHALDYGK